MSGWLEDFAIDRGNFVRETIVATTGNRSSAASNHIAIGGSNETVVAIGPHAR